MNLAEALVQALPELPTQTLATRKLKLDPALVPREEVDENGDPLIVVYVPEKACVYRIPKIQYDLLCLFDGERSFAEIAETFTANTGIDFPEKLVREMATNLADTGLWHQSAQERNITLSQKLAEERKKRIARKSKYGNFSHITFKAWDPDQYLAWANEKFSFLFTGWFNLLTLTLFTWTAYIWIGRWTEISRDTVLYYTFTQKNGWDLLEFWLLFLGIGFFHESAHGITAKHFGAGVHSMGFQLIYLTPAFAVETTELWVRSGKWQRIMSSLAGIYLEMCFCGIGTIVWWGTPPGSFAHEWAYKVMLITGFIVIVVNMNPLIKLDGYYIFSELIGIPDVKEKSTAFLSGWVRKHVFRLPVELDYVPTSRRWLYVPYAFVSGLYSYLLLYAVVRFSYNIFHRYSPEWAFIPAMALGWLIFRGRIKRFGAFMKTLYLDKKKLWQMHMTPARRAVVAAAMLLLLALPMWRKTVGAAFVLEPVQRAEVRAHVGGRVEQVFVDENSRVTAGTPLVAMYNSAVETEIAHSAMRLQETSARRNQTLLANVSIAEANSEFHGAVQTHEATLIRSRELHPIAPISGVVVTPHVSDLTGTFVKEGTPLMEIDDTSSLIARVYVPEYEVKDVRPGAKASLDLKALTRPIQGRVTSLHQAPSQPEEGLIEMTAYKGLRAPNFYVVNIAVGNPGSLMPGMSGSAKLLVGHYSLAGLIWNEVKEFVGRRLW